jgi:hypothetical protein
MSVNVTTGSNEYEYILGLRLVRFNPDAHRHLAISGFHEELSEEAI